MDDQVSRRCRTLCPTNPLVRNLRPAAGFRLSESLGRDQTGETNHYVRTFSKTQSCEKPKRAKKNIARKLTEKERQIQV